MATEHATKSTVPDNNAAGEIGPGEWNADHVGAGSHFIVMHRWQDAISAAATNLAANTFSAVSDPNYRAILDLRGIRACRILGRIGGSLVAATALRVQYHLTANPAIATGDAGWQTLATSAGGHTLNTAFYTGELLIPAAAQVNNVQIRIGLFSGDAVADPSITLAMLNLY